MSTSAFMTRLIVRLLSVVCLSAAPIFLSAPAVAGAPPASPSATRPAEASASWLGAVEEGIRKGEYHLSAHESGDGWTAPNRANDLRASWRDGALTVTPRVEGSAWTFSYRLASVGRAGSANGVFVPDVDFERVDEGRLEWERSGIVEWYENDERGIKQGFTLERRPEGNPHEAVVVEGWINGLLAYPAEDGASAERSEPLGHLTREVHEQVELAPLVHPGDLRPGGRALLHCDPAPQCDRVAAHRPCPEQHPAGCADPV